jgi:hypothetical protein
MYCNSFQINFNVDELRDEDLEEILRFMHDDDSMHSALMYSNTPGNVYEDPIVIDETSWYNYFSDLKRLSQRFPYLKIEMFREGEYRDDFEKCWFFNGYAASSMGEIVFEDKCPWKKLENNA